MNFNDILLAALFGGSSEDNSKYEEIRKLDHLLLDADIPHDFHPHMLGGYQITYYGKKGRPQAAPGSIQGAGFGAICSAIETPGSYGHEYDKIEISGLLTDEEYEEDTVVGGLTAENVFERIKKHWENELE